MAALHAFARHILQGAGGIHDDIETGDQRLPSSGGFERREIAMDPTNDWKQAPADAWRAAEARDLVSLLMESSRDRQADQPVTAEYQDAHGVIEDDAWAWSLKVMRECRSFASMGRIVGEEVYAGNRERQDAPATQVDWITRC